MKILVLPRNSFANTLPWSVHVRWRQREITKCLPDQTHKEIIHQDLWLAVKTAQRASLTTKQHGDILFQNFWKFWFISRCAFKTFIPGNKLNDWFDSRASGFQWSRGFLRKLVSDPRPKTSNRKKNKLRLNLQFSSELIGVEVGDIPWRWFVSTFVTSILHFK